MTTSTPEIGEDYPEALARLEKALNALDKRTAAVLAYHAAVEQELDLHLEVALPNASRLRTMGFGNKVRVWASLQLLPEDVIDAMIAPMLRLNDLRNSVAHGDSPQRVDAAVKSLTNLLPADYPLDGFNEIHMAAAYICGILDVGRAITVVLAERLPQGDTLPSKGKIDPE